jgi:hypothetical protein
MRSVALITLVVAAASPQQPLVTTALSLRATEPREDDSDLLTYPRFTVRLATSELVEGGKLGVTLEKNEELRQWVLSEVKNEKLAEAGVVKQQPLIKVGNKEISDAGSVDEVAKRVAEGLEGGDGVVDVEFESRRIFATRNAAPDAPRAPPKWEKVADVRLMTGEIFALHVRGQGGNYPVAEVKRAILGAMEGPTRGTMDERLMELYVLGNEDELVNDVTLGEGEFYLLLKPARVPLCDEDVLMQRIVYPSAYSQLTGAPHGAIDWTADPQPLEPFKVVYDRLYRTTHFVAQDETDYTVTTSYAVLHDGRPLRLNDVNGRHEVHDNLRSYAVERSADNQEFSFALAGKLPPMQPGGT